MTRQEVDVIETAIYNSLNLVEAELGYQKTRTTEQLDTAYVAALHDIKGQCQRARIILERWKQTHVFVRE